MARTSKIEWTERSDWNPIRGCTRVSEGCRHCYAERMAGRFSKPGMWGHGIAERTPAGARWTGRVELIEERLTLPLRWRKPAKVFVNSTSDLFHESIPDEWIDRVFAVMALCPQHTFQVLTKRSQRLLNYVSGAHGVRAVRSFVGRKARAIDPAYPVIKWPLPNVWLGVSAEDQHRADERIPDLLATPAAVRFVSCEPLLGPIDMTHIDIDGDSMVTPLRAHTAAELSEQWGEPVHEGQPCLDWVIVGGLNGPHARPMHPDWARGLRDQCAGAGVPFFFKQWGEWAPTHPNWPRADRVIVAADGTIYQPQDLAYPDGARCGDAIRAGHGADLCTMYRVGKSRSGRLLDGREHNEMPLALWTHGPGTDIRDRAPACRRWEA
jgi:protein gp37